MKKFLILAVLATLAATPALASNQPDRGARHAAHEQALEQRRDAHLTAEKSHRSAVLNQRISVTQRKLSCLQAAQTCVNGAADLRALEHCRTSCE